jgi:hypothetical protein
MEYNNKVQNYINKKHINRLMLANSLFFTTMSMLNSLCVLDMVL